MVQPVLLLNTWLHELHVFSSLSLSLFLSLSLTLIRVLFSCMYATLFHAHLYGGGIVLWNSLVAS